MQVDLRLCWMYLTHCWNSQVAVQIPKSYSTICILHNFWMINDFILILILMVKRFSAPGFNLKLEISALSP